MRTLAARHAFSLVELSVVLVILGLLTGGILTGQSMIRASQLRSVTTEYSRYVGAMTAFREKYFALPGDMGNATSYWPVAAVCPGLSGSAAAGVCNGDGNGLISGGATTSNEMFGTWEHLALAGFIDGTYTGNTGHASTAGNRTPIWGTTSPASKLPLAGWSINSVGLSPVSDVGFFEGMYDNTLSFGDVANNGTGAVLTPDQAWNIDTKLDDGRPATGSVRGRETYGGTCSDLAASNSLERLSSVYLLSNSNVACMLYFDTRL